MRSRRTSLRFDNGVALPPPAYPTRPLQMTPREATPQLGISEDRARNGVKAGVYPFGHMVGSRAVILRPELERWIEGRQLTSAKALLDVAAAAIRREAI